MSRSRVGVSTLMLTLWLVLSSSITLGQSQSGPADKQSAISSQPSKPASTGGPASDSQIAAAKASHQVWVNTDTGVYHKGGRWYGKTKAGKFMSEADTKAAEYKA